MEAECSAELIEGGVDVLKGSVDGVVMRWAANAGLRSQCGNRAKQPDAEFDDEYAESGALRREAIAARATDALHQAFGAQLGKVVAKLAEAVVIVGEPIASQNTSTHLTGCPVGGKGTRMQQCL